jgi:hypothetical protein
VKSILFSARMRRRLAWIGGTVAIVALVIAVGVMWPGRASDPPQQFSEEDAYVYHEPERVELTRVDRAKALATAANFVTYAVARRKVERSYDLTASALKGGLSRVEWSTQDIPVVPFPVEEARWKIEYSYSDALGLQVMLFPTAASKLRPSMFAMELTPTGHGKNKWLVSSWAPVGMTGANAAAAAPAAQPSGAGGVPNLGDSVPPGEARLDAKWLLAPLGLLLLVPLIVSGYYVRGWRRGRRAEALYGSRERSA